MKINVGTCCRRRSKNTTCSDGLETVLHAISVIIEGKSFFLCEKTSDEIKQASFWSTSFGWRKKRYPKRQNKLFHWWKCGTNLAQWDDKISNSFFSLAPFKRDFVRPRNHAFSSWLIRSSLQTGPINFATLFNNFPCNHAQQIEQKVFSCSFVDLVTEFEV